MARMVMCGTPAEKCYGKNVQIPTSMASQTRGLKAHPTTEDAHKCYCRYLISIGYERLGAREFTKGPDEPILLLNKKSKFGGILRSGKSAGKGGASGGGGGSKKRFNAKGHGLILQKV